MPIDAMLEITGLNEMLRGYGGKPLEPLRRAVLDDKGQPVRDEDGDVLEKELPRDQQLTLGNILLNLVARMEPEGTPKEIVLQRRVGDRLYEAMENGAAYTAGTAALAVLRKAARQNKPGYPVLIIAQAWEALGTGEDSGGSADADQGLGF